MSEKQTPALTINKNSNKIKKKKKKKKKNNNNNNNNNNKNYYSYCKKRNNKKVYLIARLRFVLATSQHFVRQCVVIEVSHLTWTGPKLRNLDCFTTLNSPDITFPLLVVCNLENAASLFAIPAARDKHFINLFTFTV